MNLMNRFKKLIMLPSVVDLGWSKTNALPMRRFQSNVQGHTWEDYHVLMKKKYPIRYFVFHTLAQFLAVHVVMPLEHLKWYIRDFVIRRTHMLDLRQSSWVLGCDDYTHGYLDPRAQMLYACMNTLDRFIEESDAKDHLVFLEEELAKLADDDPDRVVFEENCKLYREAIEIHKWWNVDRKSDFLHLERSRDYTTSDSRKLSFDRWEEFEAKEDEMMIRLVKIRRGLWN